jgi:hypothetical protein
MSLTLELPEDIVVELRDEASRQGKDAVAFAEILLAEAVQKTKSLRLQKEKEADPLYLITLPLEERRRIMRAQFEEAAPEYNADLALPLHERELTAFTALDGEPFLEPEEYILDLDK